MNELLTLEIPNVPGSAEVYLDLLKIICGDTTGKSMVDIGCYHAPYTPMLGFAKRTYVDPLDRKLDYEGEQQYFVQGDAIAYLQSCQKVDVAISSDSLEHFHLDQGLQLLALMAEKSDKQVIFTPLGEWMVNLDPENTDPDTHKTGWWPEMLDGYATVVLPHFHPALNAGAFFAWKCSQPTENQRIYHQIKQLPWIKLP